MKNSIPRFPRVWHSSESRSASAVDRRTRDRSLRSRPRFDTLEGRQLLSGVFTVSNTNDSGPGSLRAALLASDASPISPPPPSSGLLSATPAPFNIIQFSLPVGSTIAPLSPMPSITVPVETFAPVNFSQGSMLPSIVLDGSKAGVGAVGLDIQTGGNNITDLAIDDFSGGGVLFDGAAASGNWLGSDYIGFGLAGSGAAGNGTFGVEARGGASNNYIVNDVISANSGNGVVLTGSGTSNNLVQADEIGTDPTGSFAVGNGGSGVVINLGATGNTIGGNDVISGNGFYGVYISDSGTSHNVVTGSEVGTNASGTAGIGNGVNGVEILGGASSNTIGGTTTGASDIISANGGTGVVITQAGSSFNVVEGDYIGTNASGTLALGNGVFGVILSGGATSNTIGGTQTGAGDVISGNDVGVLITDTGTMGNWVEGDLIGTNAADTYAVGNTYGVYVTSGATSNWIYSDVISGNVYGVVITDSNTTGNFFYFNEIGTNASQSIGIGNSSCGVYVYGSSNNYVIGNTIAYSGSFGILSGGGASNTYAYNNVYYSGYMNTYGL